MAVSNEAFLADLQKEFGPHFDWDSIVDPATVPPVYKVKYSFWKRTEPSYVFTSEEAEQYAAMQRKDSYVFPASITITEKDGKYSVDYRRRYSCSEKTEYPTMEAAKEQVERLKVWLDVIAHTIEIEECAPSEILNRWLAKILREEVLKGERFFPILGL